jgi:hypothetical protein
MRCCAVVALVHGSLIDPVVKGVSISLPAILTGLAPNLQKRGVVGPVGTYALMCLPTRLASGEARRRSVPRPARNAPSGLRKKLPVEHGLTLFSIKCALQWPPARRFSPPSSPCIHMLPVPGASGALRLRRFAPTPGRSRPLALTQMNVPSEQCPSQTSEGPQESLGP